MAHRLPPEYRAALEAAPVALLVMAPDGTIVFANRTLSDLFSYERGELDGCPIEVLVPQELAGGHEELRTAYAHVPSQRTMGGGRGDLQGVTSDGRRVSVEVGLNTIDVAGTAFVLASVVDVTSLRSAEKQTRMVLDASASAMLLVDESSTIVLANRQSVDVFGYAEEELLGRSIDTLVPERHQRRHAVYRNSYVAEPAERAMAGDRLLHGRRADGSEFPVEIGLTPVEQDGRTMILATVIDTTERSEAEAEIRRQNEDLRRLNEELGQFAYSASHDLKSPLATLSGLLLCVEEDLDEGDLAAARANSVKSRELAGRLALLIEGILGFARSENLEPDECTIELSNLVDDIGADLAHLYAEREVKLVNLVPEDLVIAADQRRLANVIENLLANGAKFCDRSAADRFVEVEAGVDDTEPGTELVITVRDNGIGIPSVDPDEAFTMFRRFTNHAEDGTGLGLALARQHVHHLGGRISFADADPGTIFTIALPTTHQPRAAAPIGDPA